MKGASWRTKRIGHSCVAGGIGVTVLLAGCSDGKADRFASAARAHVQRSLEVKTRVGDPATTESTRCYFGIGAKDRRFVEGLQASERDLADSIVWVDCHVTGPKGEALVIAWMLPAGKAGDPALYKLFISKEGLSEEDIRRLLGQR